MGTEYIVEVPVLVVGVPLKAKRTMLPAVVMRWSPVFHIVEISEPSSLPVSNVNFTSAAVSGLPSFHVTPGRTLRT